MTLRDLNVAHFPIQGAIRNPGIDAYELEVVLMKEAAHQLYLKRNSWWAGKKYDVARDWARVARRKRWSDDTARQRIIHQMREAAVECAPGHGEAPFSA